MYKAVVFDLDDTLISEDEYIRSGYHALEPILYKKYGVFQKEIGKQLYALYEEDSRNVFNRFLDAYHINYEKEDIMQLVEEYRNHIPKIHFMEDVLPVLRELKERKIHTGIISDGYLSTQENKVKALNLNCYVEKIILTEKLGREFWKPHIKPFEIMKTFFNIQYEEMIYVGDNPKKDFYIKSQVPITTIRIIREKSVYQNAEYLGNVQEDYRIKSLEEILKFF